MFLYYQTQNDLMCYPEDSPTTSDRDKLHYNVIIFALFLMYLSIFMNNDKKF